MLVSWNWLSDYLDLRMDVAELEHRLSMAGLNHESTTSVGDDMAIDLEVTSNRPDCLGHLGVAREISVLWDRPLRIPDVSLPTSSPPVRELTNVTVHCPELCHRYTARVIRGVDIAASPDWLVDRLRSVGLAAVNNVVDVSNYVMLECGQPLHIFDFARLRGPEIIVREARAGEQFEAIDHRLYPLEPGMCVIADARDPVALGGVMGGVNSEVAPSTTDLLIEAAEFAPLSIRTTARKLNLHSPSSYRFERGVDPAGVDWASRRCCQLILELAGGELAEGVLDVGRPLAPASPITLRLDQLPRVLGIDVPPDEVRRILAALGNEIVRADAGSVQVVAPSWRRDLAREIDLVEEVARIHGYDAIPEDVGVPMAPSHRPDSDHVQQAVRMVLCSAGFDEAMTASVVPAEWIEAYPPWSDRQPLRAGTPMLKGADTLRTSLIPSLLESRRLNEAVANTVIELFETAQVYLPQAAAMPREQWTLGVVSGRDYYVLKGVVELLLETLHVRRRLEIGPGQLKLLDGERQSRLRLGDQVLGYLGELSADGLRQFGLRRPATVAELDLNCLTAVADLIPQHQPLSDYPSIARDLNLVVAEQVRWSELEATIRRAAGKLLEDLDFKEVYRDPQKDGPNKKRLFFSLTLRSSERTLTNEEADRVRQQVVDACGNAHQAELLAT